MIKKYLGLSIGFLSIWSSILTTKILSLFVGRERAVAIYGPYLTLVTTKLLKLIYLPKIKDASEFDLFKSKMKSRFWYWKLLLDFSVPYEDNDTIQFNFTYCPFCAVLMKCGYSDLAPYVCQGDWEAAKDYSDKWSFERQHQIGTGDSFCDHTYKRKQV